MNITAYSERGGSCTSQDIEPKRARIEFVPDENERNNGEFGFDFLTERILKRNAKEYEQSFVDTYTPIDNIGEDRYYVPWLSLRKDQTVHLKLEVTSLTDNIIGSVIEVSGNDANHFDICFLDANDAQCTTADTAKKIQLKCLATAENPSKIRLFINNQAAGGINILHPKPKEVNVRWYLVGYDKDAIDKVEKELTSTMLNEYFRRAFNPSLISINILNSKAKRVDLGMKSRNEFYLRLKRWVDDYITTNKLKRKERKALRFRTIDDGAYFTKLKTSDIKETIQQIAINNGESETDFDKKIRQYALSEKYCKCLDISNVGPGSKSAPVSKKDSRLEFIQTLMGYNQSASDFNVVNLFIGNISSFSTNELGGDSIDLNGGVTKAGSNACLIYYGNKLVVKDYNDKHESSLEYEPQVEIPHEVMHCLDLQDIFKAQKQLGVLFKKGRTDNYMDYNNKKTHTLKKQWDVMYNSKFAVTKKKLQK